MIVVVTTVVDSPWPRVYVRVVSLVLVMVVSCSPETPVPTGTDPVPIGAVVDGELIGYGAVLEEDSVPTSDVETPVLRMVVVDWPEVDEELIG